MTVRTLFVSPLATRLPRLCGTIGLTALVGLIAAIPASAITYTYTSGGSGLFSDTARWSGGIAPVSAVDTSLVFNNNGAGTIFPTNDKGAFTVNNVTFLDTLGSSFNTFSIGQSGGSTLVFDGTTPTVVINGTNFTAGTATPTFNLGLTFNTNTTVSVTNTEVSGVGLTLGNSGGTGGSFNSNGNTVSFVGQAASTANAATFNITDYQALSGNSNIAVVSGAGSSTGAFKGGNVTLNISNFVSSTGFAANVSLQSGAAGLGTGGDASLAWFANNATFAPVVSFVAGGGISQASTNQYSVTIAGANSAQSSSFFLRAGGSTAGTLTINGSDTYSYGGRIINGSTGALNIVKSGTGTQTFTGTAGAGQISYTGTTTVNAGTLTFATTVNNTLSGALIVNGGTLNLGSAGGTTLTASGGATVATGGTLNVLSGATVTGLTQTGGITNISGAVTGTVNVTGGTIAGTGTLPAFALNSGTTLAPAGAGIGTINATSLTFNGGGTIAFDLNQVAGTSDRVNLSGALTKGTAGAFTFDFGTTTLNTANTFTLANFGSTNFLASDFTLTGLTAGSGFNYNLVANPTNLQLVVSAVAVPESGTGILAAFGLLTGIVLPVLRRRAR